ncbi:beta-N-acetylhexosaminidase [Desertivirga brevis]|uniref:beta-N-acetylhexosaminidase n=1 Tax=Desertivirga brevis TaxID=2810310 RepID=UPI001A956454|nr:family 20 glycosylhydrolase [Pedobacter sp. SYSU D00873]
MRKYQIFLFFIALLQSRHLLAQSKNIHIIPEPVSLTVRKGNFKVDRNTTLYCLLADEKLEGAARIFLSTLKKQTGLTLPFKKTNGREDNQGIRLSLNKKADPSLHQEGYRLSVGPSSILINANTQAGVFYGLQTLLQMMPLEMKNEPSVLIPCAEILDYPRFAYRGLMLDVSRHFFTKEEVKRYIDEMVTYKYNVFHWHLTDDQGWRIEIKSLPKLNSIGSWRVPRTGPWGSFSDARPGEKATDGGFYTQEDIREVVAYASARFVSVLPEIDVPGHSLAMIASYPELSCTKMHYNVSPGTDFYKKEDNALCPGNDAVYSVMKKVIDEVAVLFPYPFIHIGGDEAYKGFWEKCEACRKRMKDENLENSTQLQSYFIRRMERIINLAGKQMIGWDEVLEGGNLSKNTTIMARYGASGTIDAVRKGHQAIVTPWGYAYWDLYQGDPAIEPLTYGKGRLKATYMYDIVPDSINAGQILGGQGSLWTEFVPTYRHAQYMTWPRSFALAEGLWSPPSKKNWAYFLERMESHFQRFDHMQVNYARSVYDPFVRVEKGNDGQLKVALECEMEGAEIFYTLDETLPDHFSKKYTGGYISFPEGAARIRAITYLKGKPAGKLLNVLISDLNKRLTQ